MRKELVGAAILLAIAGLYYFGALGIQQSTLEDEVGPQGFPAVLAALLAMVALAVGMRAILTQPAAGKSDEDDEAPWPRALGMLGIGACYIPVSMVIGYWPALLALLTAVMIYEGMKPSWRMAVVAVGGASFFWLLFEIVLGVRQPEGLLF